MKQTTKHVVRFIAFAIFTVLFTTHVAVSRGPELHNEIFVTRRMHAGLRNRNLPYRITENMIHQKTEHAALNWWLNSPIHRRSIESDYVYSCTACVGKSCAQLFTSYTPK